MNNLYYSKLTYLHALEEHVIYNNLSLLFQPSYWIAENSLFKFSYILFFLNTKAYINHKSSLYEFELPTW